MCCLYFPVSYLEKAYVKASFTTNTEDVRIQEEFFFFVKKCHFYGSAVVHSFKAAGCPSGGTTSHSLSSFQQIKDTLNTEALIEVLVEIPI